MSKLKAIQKFYSVSSPEKDVTIFEIKYSFPYRIRKKNGKFILEQSYSERSYTKEKFNRISECDSIEECYDRIIKRHNKADEYMHWGKIIVK